MTSRTKTISLFCLIAVAGIAPLVAQGLALDTPVTATDLELPVVITHAGDATDRLFIAEQTGKILVRKAGVVLPTPFLDISSLLVNPRSGEQGLLGLAFHPDYATNGYFFVNYTETEPSPPLDCPTHEDPNAMCDANSVVARYQVSAGSIDVADPAGQVLLRVNQERVNHNGGSLAFGPDGYLYIGFGDGGGGGDPFLNGQDLTTLNGSILRIDVDGTPPAQPNDLCGMDAALYGIPADNPFVGVAGACDEIWAHGLRNPWRFSFDRQSGDLFIGDVGQNAIEEIDLQPSTSTGGENYGWSCFEGTLPYPGGSASCPGPLEPPILEYPHSNPGDPDNSGSSVTGGYRYRGTLYPQLQGVYIYADFSFGRVWGTVPRCDGVWESQLLLDNPFLISTFGEDEAGEIYITEYKFGVATSQVHHLIPDAGAGGPMLAATPATMDFGSVQVGTKSARELMLSNTNAGPEALMISEMLLSNPAEFSIDIAGGSSPCNTLTPCLAPGTGCSVLLEFSPDSPGPTTETLDLTGNTPRATLALTASGVACTTSGPRVLPSETVTDTRVEEACGTLAVGSYEIGEGGDVALRAGEAVELRNGFSVLTGGGLRADIDADLMP